MLHKTHIHDFYLYIIQEVSFDSLGLFYCISEFCLLRKLQVHEYGQFKHV